MSCLPLLFRALYFLLGLNSLVLSSSSCGGARGRLPEKRQKTAEVGDRLESMNSFCAQTTAFKADELSEGNLGRMEVVGLSHEPALTASHAARSVSSVTESRSQDMTHISGQTSNIAKKLHGGLTISMHSPLS